jgi:DUF4097 and DUF4098 domain-containing protein YvlB
MTMRNRERMKRLTVPLGLAFVLTVGAGLALGREKYEEKFAKTEALAKNGKVYLANLSGDIEIQSWKEDQVKIEALKVSEASSMDKAKVNAAFVTIDVTREADVLRIETRYPGRHGFWGWDSVNVSVSYKLWIPEMASIEVKSESGDLKMASIGGAARIRTVSGDVAVFGAAGADINLVSGDLKVENVLGNAYLKTVSGNITATKVKGSVEVESVSGDLELKDVSEAKTVTGKSVSGSLTYTGTILTGGNYELTVHSGDVTMKIPANSAFDLEASTFSGTIDSDFPVQVMGKLSPKEIHGTVNGGGARIRLKSFSGSVEIKKY